MLNIDAQTALHDNGTKKAWDAPDQTGRTHCAMAQNQATP